MTDYKYKLEKYRDKHNRYECPHCHTNHKFSRYVDEKGNYLADNVGKCDREEKCGYHLTPSEYFRDKGIDYTPTITVHPKLIQPTDYIPEEKMVKTLRTENYFIQFLTKYFSPIELANTIEKYRIGDTKDGKIIYWQIDNENRVRTGKMMLYNSETGRRVKNVPNAIDWVHRYEKQPFQLDQCLYGLHLINREKPIAIVESEKTAIISSLTVPLYTWMATGGKQNFRLMEALKGFDVTLFPDLGAFEKWKVHADNYKFKITDVLEQVATNEERHNGLDIADYILKQI